MFRKKHSGRRSANPIFVIFRLTLSLVMFAILLGGVYSAYKHFSGLDPLKLDPQAILKNVLEAKTPKQFLSILGEKKDNQSVLQNLTPQRAQIPQGNLLFKFLLLSDSHNDNANLRKAITQAKQAHPDLAFIIGLGDFSDVGTIEELKAAKKELDLGGLRYFLIPGDHDLWDSRNRSLPPTSDFNGVFGPTYQSFNYQNFKFILLDNSDDYKGLGDEQLKWINSELEKNSLVFVHEPLYHPSSDHVMGKVEKNLKDQAKSLIIKFSENGVKKVFAGDIHYFSEYEEPQTNLSMVTIGAITSERNPQAPRYGVVSVFDNGTTKVEDIEVR